MVALTIQNLTKAYANGVQALNGVSLGVQKGDFFGLLGPNGAGKTTIIGIISSLVLKTSGQVSIFEYDIDQTPIQAKSLMGVVPQEFNFYIFDKVKDIILNQAGFYGLPRKLAKTRMEKYLKLLELWDKRDQRVRFLSGGMKRRLMIARAMVHDPKILILDEPTAGIDIEVRRSMWKFIQKINEQGVTIILTTHYLEEAENLCRHIAVINHGKVIKNTSVQALVQELACESFILDLMTPIDQIPELPDYMCSLINPTTLEIGVNQGQTITAVFDQLRTQNITVKSLRNKANRLETLLLNLVDQKNE